MIQRSKQSTFFSLSRFHQTAESEQKKSITTLAYFILFSCLVSRVTCWYGQPIILTFLLLLLVRVKSTSSIDNVHQIPFSSITLPCKPVEFKCTHPYLHRCNFPLTYSFTRSFTLFKLKWSLSSWEEAHANLSLLFLHLPWSLVIFFTLPAPSQSNPHWIRCTWRDVWESKLLHCIVHTWIDFFVLTSQYTWRYFFLLFSALTCIHIEKLHQTARATHSHTLGVSWFCKRTSMNKLICWPFLMQLFSSRSSRDTLYAWNYAQLFIELKRKKKRREKNGKLSTHRFNVWVQLQQRVQCTRVNEISFHLNLLEDAFRLTCLGLFSLCVCLSPSMLHCVRQNNLQGVTSELVVTQVKKKKERTLQILLSCTELFNSWKTNKVLK